MINYLRKICQHPYIFIKSYTKDHDNRFSASGKAKEVTALRVFNDFKRQSGQDNLIDLCTNAYKLSSKIRVLLQFLKTWSDEKESKNKVLIFCQYKKSIDILENLSQQNGYEYLRLDGSVRIQDRQALINRFNNDPNIFLFFLTTKTGGLGINLKGANKVIVYDPDWNPMVDLQATDRALRIGQKRDVQIFRLMVDSSVEENIYRRQVFKKYLSERVLENPTINRVFEEQSLYELFKYPKAEFIKDDDTEITVKQQNHMNAQDIAGDSKTYQELMNQVEKEGL